MLGRYKANAEHLAALRDEAHRVASNIGTVKYDWNRREENAEADLLVNLALDGLPVPPVAGPAASPQETISGPQTGRLDRRRPATGPELARLASEGYQLTGTEVIALGEYAVALAEKRERS